MTSVDKAMSLLDAFVGSSPVLGVTELAERAGVPKSTAHRILSTLVAAGYVTRVGDRYALADKLFELGQLTRHVRPRGLRDYATPYIAELQATTGQTVHLAVLTGPSVLYLDKIYGHEALQTPTAVGAHRPATCTALGRAMLAYAPSEVVGTILAQHQRQFTPFTATNPDSIYQTLEHVREEGFASENNEFWVGMQCVASPVVDRRTGQAVAAISVSFPSSSQAAPRIARHVLRNASALSERVSMSPLARI